MAVSPSTTQAVGRPDLGATLTEFDVLANGAGFVGLQLFPPLDVQHQSANIGRIPIEQLLQEQDTSRASGGGYRRGNFTFDDFSYATQEHGWEEPIDARNAKIYARYFDAEVIAARRARNFVVQNHENRCIAKATSTTLHTNVAAGTAWSTPATATPITLVKARLVAIRQACGLAANTVVMDYEAYLAAIETAQVIDRLKYAGFDDPKDIGEAALAKIFGVRRVIVAGALKNTAAEGSLTLTSRWPKGTVAVGRTAETNDVAEPCLGRTFHWSEDGSSIGGTLESYYENAVRADIIRVRMETDEKEMYPECWQLITGVLA